MCNLVILLNMNHANPRHFFPSYLSQVLILFEYQKSWFSSPDMEALSFLFGILGNAGSLLVIFAPIGTFWRIFKKGSTEGYDSFPYISVLLNASLWTYYGIVKPGAYLVATVNGFGALVQVIYIAIFLAFAPPKLKVKTTLLVVVLNVVFPVAAIGFTMLQLKGEVRINSIGFICAGLNIVMCGSPLSSMRMVVKTRSVEYMPLCLSISLFLSAASWALYGFFTHDYFLLVPNGIGFILGMFQFLLYAIYKEAKPSTKSGLEGLEEGWQHQPLIVPS